MGAMLFNRSNRDDDSGRFFQPAFQFAVREFSKEYSRPEKSISDLGNAVSEQENGRPEGGSVLGQSQMAKQRDRFMMAKQRDRFILGAVLFQQSVSRRAEPIESCLNSCRSVVREGKCAVGIEVTTR